ncbi:cytochrome P450 [Trametes gibbosa]|nr:cytochrome P450 [Trametes gibbosa]
MSQITDRKGWDFHKHIAQTYGRVVKLHWLFSAPMLYISDPLAMDRLVKDSETYDEPAWYMDGNLTLFGPGVLAVSGDVHRKQRKMLAPVFAAKHLRTMVPVFYRVVGKLVAAISAHVPENNAAAIDVDILGWTSRAALELIGQAGIGCSLDPLTEHVPDAYADAMKNLSSVATAPDMILLRQILPYVKDIGPLWLRRWLLRRLPIHNVQRMIHISETLHQRSVEIFEAKRAAIEAGEKTEGTDIMSILLRANMASSEVDRLPEDQLLGQMSVIIFAAMETTSNAMARTLQLLAEHPKVQIKLRKEIIEAKGGDAALDYDRLHALPYLDAVCRESLRLYPPGVQTFRCATKDAVLPLSQPIRGTDGTILNELAIPRGTNIFVAIMESNCDEALWGPDAREWKPERWLAALPAAVEHAKIPGVYSNMMTFMGGVRSCVGFTFSQLEMKVVLSELLVNFAFELSDTPIVWNLSGVTYPSVSEESTKVELWLRARRCQEDDGESDETR